MFCFVISVLCAQNSPLCILFENLVAWLSYFIFPASLSRSSAIQRSTVWPGFPGHFVEELCKQESKDQSVFKMLFEIMRGHKYDFVAFSMVRATRIANFEDFSRFFIFSDFADLPVAEQTFLASKSGFWPSFHGLVIHCFWECSFFRFFLTSLVWGSCFS